MPFPHLCGPKPLKTRSDKTRFPSLDKGRRFIDNDYHYLILILDQASTPTRQVLANISRRTPAMLNDFFTIELYFGSPESAQIQEDLIRRYGYKPVHEALERGYLEAREIFCGPLRGRILCWLSEKGRHHVREA